MGPASILKPITCQVLSSLLLLCAAQLAIAVNFASHLTYPHHKAVRTKTTLHSQNPGAHSAQHTAPPPKQPRFGEPARLVLQPVPGRSGPDRGAQEARAGPGQAALQAFFWRTSVDSAAVSTPLPPCRRRRRRRRRRRFVYKMRRGPSAMASGNLSKSRPHINHASRPCTHHVHVRITYHALPPQARAAFPRPPLGPSARASLPPWRPDPSLPARGPAARARGGDLRLDDGDAHAHVRRAEPGGGGGGGTGTRNGQWFRHPVR